MSNSVAVQQRRFIQIAPDNNLATFSPVSSQNILKFTIADTQALLQTKDLRLNFKISFHKAGGSNFTLGEDVNIDANTGMNSVIDQLYISSLRFNTGQTLEAIHNASRLSASMYSALFSPKAHMANANMEQKSVGKASFNEDSAGKGTDGGANDPLKKLQRKALLKTANVSMRLNAGVLMSQPMGIDLSQLGGMRLDIYLQQNISAVLFGSAVGADAYYEISDVSLTCPLLYKSMDMIQASRNNPASAFNFLSYTSIYGVIDSTVSTLSHKVNFKGLVSVVQNSIMTDHINNLSFNNNALENFGGIRDVRFSRNGSRFPYEYDIINDRENDEDTPTNSSNCNQALLLETYLSAYRNPEDIKRTSVCPQTTKGQLGVLDGNYGVGASFDSVSGAGINVNGNLAYNYSTKLEDTDNASRNNTQAYGVYSYYLTRNSIITGNQGGGLVVAN